MGMLQKYRNKLKLERKRSSKRVRELEGVKTTVVRVRVPDVRKK